MHEMTIALNIIEIAEEQAKLNEVQSFSEIELEVGEVSGVVPEALQFALDSAIKDSVLEQAHIKILVVPAQTKCRACAAMYRPDDLFSICPSCSAFNNDVIAGKELKVSKLAL